MSHDSNHLVVGRFGRAHGLKGFVAVHSFTEPRENILGYAPWSVYFNQQWQNLKVLQHEITDKHILVQIADFNEREKAASLTNLEIVVPKEQLPSLSIGEYYWHQLVGLTVVNNQAEVLGLVVEILPTGSNDVLIVQGERRVLIPYLPGDTIKAVDIPNGRINVSWDMDY